MLDPELDRRLEAEGALTVAELFGAGGAVERYYEREATLGGSGDFVTAPEISQVFGELVGLWLADAWQRQGAPVDAVVVELGPGRGTLMRDLDRARRLVAGFAEAPVHLVERSRRLATCQAEALALLRPTFHGDLSTLPDAPLFVVGNEFLDALPVHQLVAAGNGWRERVVCARDGAPAWDTAPAPTSLAARADDLFPRAQAGDVAEVAPAREALIAELAGRIAKRGGAALFVDYGAAAPAPVDTLQAVARHRPVDVLATLGTADLTTAVAFAPLRAAAEAVGAAVFGPRPQAQVLRALGIELRALKLVEARRGAEREAVLAGVRRLLDPRAMGELYKMLAVLPGGASAPAGFDLAAVTP